jgi:hypothetical protein
MYILKCDCITRLFSFRIILIKFLFHVLSHVGVGGLWYVCYRLCALPFVVVTDLLTVLPCSKGFVAVTEIMNGVFIRTKCTKL